MPPAPQWQEAPDLAAFWKEAQALLLARESVYNLTIGLILGGLSGERRWSAPRMLLLRGAEAVAGVAIQTDATRPVALGPMPVEAVASLVDRLLSLDPRPPRVVGERVLAEAFAAAWVGQGGTATVGMRQGIYEATSITAPDPKGGRLVQAGPADRDLVVAMAEGFGADALRPSERALHPPAELVDRLLGRGHIHLWEDAAGRRVSMAARNRETPSTATISLVYTPPPFRGRGHASRCVAALSRIHLRTGKRACNLYTDLANPTSNSIYRRIGYQSVGESRMYELG